MNTTRKILLAALAAVVILFFVTGTHNAYAAGVAAEAHKPGKDLNDVYEYVKEVHGYAYGNSYYIKVLNEKKVSKTEFYADQERQDKRIGSAHDIAVNADQKADAGFIRIDAVEKHNVKQDVAIDAVEKHNGRQDVAIDALNKQANTISNTLNAHGDTLSNHQAQINELGSRLSSDVANALNTANEAHRQAKIAQDQAVASLAVAGHSYDHSNYGLQTAISAASFGGSTAVAVGFGGKVSERMFVNGSLTSAGSATGGVVSSTFAW